MPLPLTGYDEFTISNPFAAVVDFSLMLDLSLMSANWWATVDTTDPTKGRAAKGDGTELAVDWIDFDSVNKTGWVRIKWSGTLASSGTQVLRVYPPKAANASVAAGDTFGRHAAYDSDWVAYWPLSEDFNDRTANAVNMSGSGGIAAGGVAGKVGQATDFDGIDDYLTATPSGTEFESQQVTLMAWVGGTQTDNWQGVFNYSANGMFGNVMMGRRGASNDIYIEAGGAEVRGGDFTTGPKHYAGVIDTSVPHIQLFENLTSLGTGSPGTISYTGTKVDIGRTHRVSNDLWDGTIEEAQWHAAVRADEWIAHEYAQTNDPATFWGSPTWAAGGGNRRRRFFAGAAA